LILTHHSRLHRYTYQPFINILIILNMSDQHFYKMDPNNSSCSICLGHLEDTDLPVSDLECNHRFHTKCIRSWQIAHGEGSHRLCPNCRKPIKYKNSHDNIQMTDMSDESFNPIRMPVPRGRPIATNNEVVLRPS